MADDFLTRMAEVIVTWPLYRPFRFSGNVIESRATGGVGGLSGPRTVTFVRVPSVLSMVCPGCGQEERWQLRGAFDGPFAYRFEKEFTNLEYRCKSCETARVTYFLFVDITDAGGQVVKVGQFPALERAPLRVVAASMSEEDRVLYRHALTCRHSAFGIGAVAYLRRIIENQINFILDLIAGAAEAEEPDSPLVKRLMDMKGERRFADKIEYAANMLPKSIRRGGQNPIATLHELASEGLHAKSDEECIEIFDRCRLAFEYVVKRLKEDKDEDAAYQDALKALSGKKETK